MESKDVLKRLAIIDKVLIKAFYGRGVPTIKQRDAAFEAMKELQEAFKKS